MKSELNRVSDQLLEVQTRNSELQEENARILQRNTELGTENAEIRKENADLKVQAVSDSINHTSFDLNISLCSRLLSMIVSLESRSFSRTRYHLVAQILPRLPLKEYLRRGLGLPSLSMKQRLPSRTRPPRLLLGAWRAWRSPLQVNTLYPETVMRRSRCRLFLRCHPQMELQFQSRFDRSPGRAVKHLVNLSLHLLLVALTRRRRRLPESANTRSQNLLDQDHHPHSARLHRRPRG